MKPFRFLILGAAALALSACETMDGLVADIDSLNLPSLSMDESDPDNLIYSGHCPEVDIVKELRALTEFSPPVPPSEQNLISRVTLTDLETACRSDENSVTVDLRMTFDGMLGPKGRSASAEKPLYSYPFFVAVADSGGDIMAKEIFSAGITYAPGSAHQTYYENMRQIIPLDRYDRASRYKILVGFQLGPEQLTYNRSPAGRTMINAQMQAAGGEQIFFEPQPGVNVAPAPAPDGVQITPAQPSSPEPTKINVPFD